MSTRANVIIKDDSEELIFYRHSDGYPSCTGEDLKDFVRGYANGAMRSNPPQSAGWLILRGHFEYNETPRRSADPTDRTYGWKVGAYEPAACLAGDVAYIYEIHLTERTLRCYEPTASFWDKPTRAHMRLLSDFPTVRFEAEDV